MNIYMLDIQKCMLNVNIKILFFITVFYLDFYWAEKINSDQSLNIFQLQKCVYCSCFGIITRWGWIYKIYSITCDLLQAVARVLDQI